MLAGDATKEWMDQDKPLPLNDADAEPETHDEKQEDVSAVDNVPQGDAVTEEGTTHDDAPVGLNEAEREWYKSLDEEGKKAVARKFKEMDGLLTKKSQALGDLARYTDKPEVLEEVKYHEANPQALGLMRFIEGDPVLGPDPMPYDRGHDALPSTSVLTVRCRRCSRS